MKKMTRIVLAILLCVATLIQLTIKDSYYVTSLIFYAFPSIVIFGISVLLLILSWKTTKRKLLIVITAISAVFWLSNSYVMNTKEVAPATKKGIPIHIVFWNGYKENNLEDAIAELGFEPDLLVILEYDITKKKSLEKIIKQYPKYHFKKVINKMGIMAKQEIGSVAIHRLKDNSVMFAFNTKIRNTSYAIYAVDVSAGLAHFRKQPLNSFFSTIKKNKNTIVMGDFNTPYESVHFNPYKAVFNHCFSTKGTGFRATWFWNIPLLSLDHIWISKDIQLETAEKLKTWKSDHSLIKISIR